MLKVGGLRYNFDTEQPTLLDIESIDNVTDVEKRNSLVYRKYFTDHTVVYLHSECRIVQWKV